MFSAIAGRSSRGTAGDSLEEYLESPPRTTVKDPLAYWHAAVAGASEDASLARMALDFLSIPGELIVCLLCCELVTDGLLY